MTNAKRLELGLPEKHPRAGRVGPPTVEPYATITNVEGRRVTLLLQSSKTKAGRPKGAVSANVFVAYGEQMPSQPSQFQLYTGTNRSRIVLNLNAVETATTAWISVCWVNYRKQSGPACDPISVELAAMRVKPQVEAAKVRKAA